MKIAVLSCNRLPSKADSLGGLSKSAHDAAVGLAERGHEVTLVGAHGSEFEEGQLVQIIDEHALVGYAYVYFTYGKVDVIFDYSHSHGFSDGRPDHTLPVLNVIGDNECRYTPPNAVTASKFMQARYKNSRLIRTGVRNVPFYPKAKDYLVFMGILHPNKGFLEAVRVAVRLGIPIKLMGQNWASFHPVKPNEYVGVMKGKDKWNMLGNAIALLAPYKLDASPRAPIEAAYCGVPTICLEGDGTEEHVENDLTGFVCESFDEMVQATEEAGDLDRSLIHNWAEAAHSFDKMIDEYEAALIEVANGGRW